HEVTFNAPIAAGSDIGALLSEIGRQECAHGFAGAKSGLGLFASWVAAKAGSGVQLHGSLPRPGSCQSHRRAERYPPVLHSDLVLKDERARAAGSQAIAESGHLVVKDNDLGPVFRQWDGGNASVG